MKKKRLKLKTEPGLYQTEHAGLTSDEITTNLDMNMSLSYKYSTFSQQSFITSIEMP